MTMPEFENDRFRTQAGFRMIVQVPDSHAQAIMDAVIREDVLVYGDYDRVSFRTALGTQTFRSIGTGRNIATEGVVEVPCCEISFFLPHDEDLAIRVLKAVYDAHPYEEPVMSLAPCIRTLHISGLDEDNPNRFWNNAPQAWVPDVHR